MTWYREWFGEEYLDLYSYRDEEEARRQVAFFEERFGPIFGLSLDLACGTGRHIQELVAKNYRFVGSDLSYVLLRSGLREYGGMDVVRADMRDMPFRDGSFAALVNFFTSFGYFSEEEDNLRVVREMSRVLRRGAPFLFDYMNVSREIKMLVPREVRETESGQAHIQRWFDPAERSINKRISIGGKSFLERVRAYDLDEISVMFASSKFSISDIFGDFDGNPYSDDSRRLIVVGKKL